MTAEFYRRLDNGEPLDTRFLKHLRPFARPVAA